MKGSLNLNLFSRLSSNSSDIRNIPVEHLKEFHQSWVISCSALCRRRCRAVWRSCFRAASHRLPSPRWRTRWRPWRSCWDLQRRNHSQESRRRRGRHATGERVPPQWAVTFKVWPSFFISNSKKDSSDSELCIFISSCSLFGLSDYGNLSHGFLS